MEVKSSKGGQVVSSGKSIPTGVVGEGEVLLHRPPAKKDEHQKKSLDTIGTAKSSHLEGRVKATVSPRTLRAQKMTEHRLMIILLVLIGFGLIMAGLLYGLSLSMPTLS